MILAPNTELHYSAFQKNGTAAKKINWSCVQSVSRNTSLGVRHHEDGDGWSSTFDWTDRPKMDDIDLWPAAVQGSETRQLELDKEIQTLNTKTWWHAHDHELCGCRWLLDGSQWHRENSQFNFFWCLKKSFRKSVPPERESSKTSRWRNTPTYAV